MFFLISYDIPVDKRRNKIAKTLLDYGDRVQYSVFECNLTHTQVLKLVKELKAIVNEGEDSLRIYRFCADCKQLVQAIGQAKPPVDDPEVYIV